MQFFMLAWCTGPDVLQRRSKNHRSGQYDWYAWTLDQHSIHVAMLHHRCRCLGRFGRGEWDSLGGTRVREGRSMPNYPSQHGWIAPQMYRVHRSYSLRWPCFLVAFWFYTVNSQIAEQPWSCVPIFSAWTTGWLPCAALGRADSWSPARLAPELTDSEFE